MQLNITGHHVDLTDAMKDYVSSKLQKLERHNDQINNVQVTLVVEKLRHRAEAVMHVNGVDIHGNAEQDDMYAAIDLLIDKLDRQILKQKEKHVARSHGTANR